MFLAALMLCWLVDSLRHSFECTNMADYLFDMKEAHLRMKQASIWAAIKAATPCRCGFLSKIWLALSAVLYVQLSANVFYSHACELHNQPSACFCVER